MSGDQPDSHYTQNSLAHMELMQTLQQNDGSNIDAASLPAVVTSRFSDFSLPFSCRPPPDQSGGLLLPEQANFDFNDAASSHYPQPHSHHSIAHSLPISPHTITAPSAIQPIISLHTDSAKRRLSLDTSDDAAAEDISPTADSLEDVVPDDNDAREPDCADGTDLGRRGNSNSIDAPPAWSELKTKAGKDRKRLPLACIACRRKKIRCSGEKPACKHCLRSRIPCVYRVTTRKAAPRTDYMAMLDKRLKRMEERVIKIIPCAEHSALSHVIRAVVKPAIPGTKPQTKVLTKKRGISEAFGLDLESLANAPVMGATVAANEDRSPSSGLRHEDWHEDLLFGEGGDALPSTVIQEHLAEVFFDHVYGQAYQLLHKPSYMRKLKSNALPPVLILSVCAVAARFSSHPKITTSTRQFLRGEIWASHARDICMKRYEWPSITILTCLLILGLHDFGTCHGGRSWALGGQAIRMAFALQLHKDLEHDPLCSNSKAPLSFIDREIRRRIMWACFMMDRFNSSGSDRPLFIVEEAIKIQLPVSERHFQLDMPIETEALDCGPRAHSPAQSRILVAKENMSAAAYTIRSIAIWGRIITYLNEQGYEVEPQPMWIPQSKYAKLVQDVNDFINTLPPTLTYSLENLRLHASEKTAGQFLLLHLSVQQNLLFLSQAAVTSANSSVGQHAPDDFIACSSTRRFAAANHVSEILIDAEQCHCNIHAPFAGYCAFSSTSIHIVAIFSGNPAVKAAAEINSGVNIRFLRRLMRIWGPFQGIVENIRTQYRTALADSQSRDPRRSKNLISALMNYADWLDKYPHNDGGNTDERDSQSHLRKRERVDAVLQQKSELQSVEFFTHLSPPQTAGTKDEERGKQPKRKQTTIKAVDAAKSGLDSQSADMEKSSAQLRSSSFQERPRPPPMRRFSSSLSKRTDGPAATRSLATVQPHASIFASVSPVSPLQGQHYSPQIWFANTIAPYGMVPTHVSQPPDELPQPSARQLENSENWFDMASGGHHQTLGTMLVMDNANGWAVSTAKGDGQRSMSVDGRMGHNRGLLPEGHLLLDALNDFSEHNSAGWYMPLDDMGSAAKVDHNAAPRTNQSTFSHALPSSEPMFTPEQLATLRRPM